MLATIEKTANVKAAGKRNALKITLSPDVEITSAKIEKILNNALLQLPSPIAVAVVEVATGTCLAYHSRSRSFDPTIAASYNAEIVRQKQQAMVALKMRGERLEDILIPFRKQLHLLRLSKKADNTPQARFLSRDWFISKRNGFYIMAVPTAG